MNKFKVIYADPPWQFRFWGVMKNRSKSGGVASEHYPTEGLEYLKSLPVGDLADKDSVLLLWSTFPTIQEAFELAKAWGFEYKTAAFVWAKLNKNYAKKPISEIDRMFFFGMGYYTRANTEVCLLFVKGHPKRISNTVRQLVVEPIKRHSEKPKLHSRIEQLFSGPYIELFAREKVANWITLGNEVNDGKLMHEVLDPKNRGCYLEIPE